MNLTIPTSDTRIAASLATLGVPLTPEVLYDEKNGNTDITFHMELKSVLKNVNVETNVILKRLKEKSLSPVHPVNECLRAIHNRRCLIKFLNEMAPIHLVQAAKGDRYIYVYGGTGLPGCSGEREMFFTYDIKVVAAMGNLGVPLLAVDDSGQRKFYMPLRGLDLNGESVDGAAILRDFRSGQLAINDPEHPFLYAMIAQNSYASILQAVEKQEELVLLRKPNSTKAAYIRSGASDKAFDIVHRHFGV